MSGLTSYQENAVTTQSRGHLVVLLYDGAIKNLNQAVEALEAKDLKRKGECVGKALDILNELNVSLDFDSAEELCSNLRSLYLFMIRHLTTAHIKNDVQMMQDVIGLLEEINQAWREISD